MKYHFGKTSKGRLSLAVVEIREIMELALSYGIMDFMVVETVRSKASQDRYFLLGKSKVKWPNSKHNLKPGQVCSRAIDVAPWINGKISWRKEHCLILSGIILAAAAELGYKIRWGGNWDMDGEPITDQQFQDLVHYEYLL